MGRVITPNVWGQRAASLLEAPLFNAVWFNVVWFCLVVGRERLLPLGFAVLAFHLLLVDNRFAEYRRLSLLAAIGIAVDSLLTWAGVFAFQDTAFIPVWLVCLWIAFAATLPRSLAFLGRYPVPAAATGALGGACSYWAGQRFGAVTFGYPLFQTLVMIALVWAVLFPALLRVSRKLSNGGDQCP